MKKIYSIRIEPKTLTRQGLKNIEKFLSELSGLDGVEVSDDKLEFICESEMEDKLNQLSEKYSIVNLIGLFYEGKD